MPKRKFLSFDDARMFVRALACKSQLEWVDYCSSGKKPKNIPSNPGKTYGADFQSWGDWLGTNRIANQLRDFLPFEEARAFVWTLNIKSTDEWSAYCKSGKKPENIPADPRRTYKDDFQNMGNWLGTGTIASYYREYLPFEDARTFVRSLGLRNQKEWNEYRKSSRKPENIPTNPNTVYSSQFQGYGDWLGTDSVSSHNREYMSFEEARTLVHALNLRNHHEWSEYSKSEQRPKNIPGHPCNIYKDEWQGYGDWLGTGNIAVFKREFLPFEEAISFVRALSLKSMKEWYMYCQSKEKPLNIPSNPDKTYGVKFQGYGDWLGTGRVANQLRDFLPFEDARSFVWTIDLKRFKDWDVYCRSGQRPDNIPSDPQSVYRTEFQGWADWLRGSKKLERLTSTRIERDVAHQLRKQGISYVEQYRIGRYVVDFWIADWNLVLECDGCFWHSCLLCGYDYPEKRDRDRIRTQFLEKHGCCVVHLWEHDILANVEDAVSYALRID